MSKRKESDQLTYLQQGGAVSHHLWKYPPWDGKLGDGYFLNIVGLSVSAGVGGYIRKVGGQSTFCAGDEAPDHVQHSCERTRGALPQKMLK
jgi:hypothetical protein